jgi:hypothetical protein
MCKDSSSARVCQEEQNMGNHDEFDLDVRLGNGRSLMEGSPLRGGGDVTDTCETCETCPAICTGQTCADQNTCATCDTQCGQDTCGTCATCDDTCGGTCATHCDQDTCGIGQTCESCLTACEQNTCLSCSPPHTCDMQEQCLPK